MTTFDQTAIENALAAWLNLAVGNTSPNVPIPVQQADQPAPRSKGPYLSVKIIAGPSRDGWDHKGAPPGNLYLVTVATVLNGTLYTVTIDGTDFTFMSDADATALEIAAGLVAAVNAGSSDVDATDNLDGTFTLALSTSATQTTFILLVDANLEITEGLDERLTGDREFTVSVQAIRGTPLQLLADVQDSLQRFTVMQTLRAAGLSFRRDEGVVDVTELLSTADERRANLDFIFALQADHRDQTGVVESVEVTDTLDGVERTFTVP